MGSRGAGGAGLRGGVAQWLAAVLKLGLLAAGIGGLARAEGGLRPLDYHATVVNGSVVGSAFAVADGYAVTNRHVVAGLRPGDPVAMTASARGRSRAEARLVAISPRMDLALLRVPDGFLPRIAEDAAAAAGLRVAAAGIDGGGGPREGALLELPGQVVDPAEDIPAFGPGLVVWLPGARPGISGGPLLDGGGRLVGMVTAIRPGPAGAVPVSGFRPAAPASATVEAFVLRGPELRAEVRRLLRRR
jgi:S1-C subfamily serine protease